MRQAKSGRFKVGDRVWLETGRWRQLARVLENRGPLGVGGRHIYRVEVPIVDGETDAFEMPEDQLTLADVEAELQHA